MSRLLAKHCLSQEVTYVDEEDRPNAGKYFAVFSTETKDFVGLVSKARLTHRSRIFADLIHLDPGITVHPETPAKMCEEKMRQLNLDALPVMDESNRFLGVVTHSTILSCILSLRNASADKSSENAQMNERNLLINHSLIDLFYLSKSDLQQKQPLKKALTTVANILEVRQGLLILFDKKDVTKIIWYGFDAEVRQRMTNLICSWNFFAKVASYNDTVEILNNGFEFEKKRELFPGAHPDTLIAVRIKKSDEVYGCMYLADKTNDQPFTDDDKKLVLSFSHILSLILENRKKEEQIYQLAHRDPLTNLPNRLQFNADLQTAVSLAKQQAIKMAVFYLDVESFNHINALLGTEAGDELLQEITTRLGACLREQDKLARIGGDEFALILGEIKDKHEAETTAEHIIHTLSQPYFINHHHWRIAVNIGIALFPNNGRSAVTLLKKADSALHSAKSLGKNCYKVYDSVLRNQNLRIKALELEMPNALTRGEFFVVYQPRFYMDSKSLAGMEALARWNNSNWNNIPPNEFIPIAEKTGFILQLGEAILKKACEEYAHWRKKNSHLELILAVNVSPQQLLKKSFVKTVADILQQNRIPPTLLELEITETAVMAHYAEIIDTINKLRELGVRLAIDDFGIGHSSLERLKKLPVHALKIDQSFVKDIGINPHDALIVKAIISLGRSLGLTLVAEGVETQAAETFLLENHCLQAQGYRYSKPIINEQMQQLILSRF